MTSDPTLDAPSLRPGPSSSAAPGHRAKAAAAPSTRHPGPTPRSLFRAVGSLWFAAVLLMLWLVAMASATVFESTYGPERALATFYRSAWFQLILALLAMNVLAALALRFPYTRGQVGFVLTHVGIVVTLAGAVGTKFRGVDGQVSIVEGETANRFSISEPMLLIQKRRDRSESIVDLPPSVFSGFRAVDDPEFEALRLGDVRVVVLRYLPDSDWAGQVRNDGPLPRPAIEVAFAPPGEGEPTWLFGGRSIQAGPVELVYRPLRDQAELNRLLSETRPASEPSDGRVKIEYEGAAFDIPLQTCLNKAVPLGDTGLTLRVLRYMPHAMVGADNKLANVSDRPINPTIEAEILGPDIKETRLAFARFPDFGSSHGDGQVEELKLTFTAPPGEPGESAMVEVFRGPEGSLHVRFAQGGAGFVVKPLTLGVPVDVPGSGRSLTVLRRFENARVDFAAIPVEPVRARRTPAVLVKLTSPTSSSETWVQKYRSRLVQAGGAAYDVVFADKTLPLGFEVKLNSFTVGTYPGERRPRSFESRITIIDPEADGPQDRLISMNNPTSHGGYTFYQSSYREEAGRSTSVLSVSRDPGKPVVFTGYFTMMAGMILALVLRMKERRRVAG